MSVEAFRLKRFVPMLALLLVAASAHAAGMGLRWGSCEGADNRNFACDGGSGAEVLVASFSPPAGLGPLTGVAVTGRISAAGSGIPPWWQMAYAGACRKSSLSVSFTLSDETECEDPWQGQAMGGVASYRPDAQGAEFLIAVAVPESMAPSVSNGRSYAALKMFINHQRSSGPSSCAGCSTPVCITLEKMQLGQFNHAPHTEVAPPEIVITDARSGLGGAGNVVKWQGGTPRCGAGAAKASTWTELKRIYH